MNSRDMDTDEKVAASSTRTKFNPHYPTFYQNAQVPSSDSSQQLPAPLAAAMARIIEIARKRRQEYLAANSNDESGGA